MSKYRVEPMISEEAGDLGVIDVCLYEEESDKLLGKMHLTDKGVIAALKNGKEPEFAPYATFAGCEAASEDKDEVKEVMEKIFSYLAGKGVKEVNFHIGNQTKEPFLKNIGFELAEENRAGFYPIFIYRRVLSEDASMQFLSQTKQHGEDSTWGKF